MDWVKTYVAFSGSYKLEVDQKANDEWDWSIYRWTDSGWLLVCEAEELCDVALFAKAEATQRLEEIRAADQGDPLRGAVLSEIMIDEQMFFRELEAKAGTEIKNTVSGYDQILAQIKLEAALLLE